MLQLAHVPAELPLTAGVATLRRPNPSLIPTSRVHKKSNTLFTAAQQQLDGV